MDDWLYILNLLEFHSFISRCPVSGELIQLEFAFEHCSQAVDPLLRCFELFLHFEKLVFDALVGAYLIAQSRIVKAPLVCVSS